MRPFSKGLTAAALAAAMICTPALAQKAGKLDKKQVEFFLQELMKSGG